jgi:hypothetical protein
LFSIGGNGWPLADPQCPNWERIRAAAIADGCSAKEGMEAKLNKFKLPEFKRESIVIEEAEEARMEEYAA